MDPHGDAATASRTTTGAGICLWVRAFLRGDRQDYGLPGQGGRRALGARARGRGGGGARGGGGGGGGGGGVGGVAGGGGPVRGGGGGTGPLTPGGGGVGPPAATASQPVIKAIFDDRVRL